MAITITEISTVECRLGVVNIAQRIYGARGQRPNPSLPNTIMGLGDGFSAAPPHVCSREFPDRSIKFIFELSEMQVSTTSNLHSKKCSVMGGQKVCFLLQTTPATR